MSFRKLQREWYAKLKAFPDVLDEGPDGEGRLSDRGNLHPVAETRQEDERLSQRIEDGGSYIAWATSVLHDGPGFRTKQVREAWRLHAEGLSEVDIGSALTISRGRVRDLLDETRSRVSKVSKAKRWRNAKRQRVSQFQALCRRCDPRILAKLVAVMMRQQGLS